MNPASSRFRSRTRERSGRRTTDRALYRSRDGVLFGVCKGVAQYADLSVFWFRVVMVVAAALTYVIPFLLAYLVAAVLMKPEPVMEPESPEDWDFYHSYASSRTVALARLKSRFESLERRTRRIENMVTAREFEWDQRMRMGH